MSAALAFLRNPAFLNSDIYIGQQWRADRSRAHSDIIEFESRMVKHCAKLGIPMFAHNMFRTPAEQDALYVKGVTKARGGNSPHQHGLAVDIVHSNHAWNLQKAHWDLLGHIGKEVATQANIAIEWGGDWNFYDPAHWQLKDWKNHVNHGHPGAPRRQQKPSATVADFTSGS